MLARAKRLFGGFAPSNSPHGRRAIILITLTEPHLNKAGTFQCRYQIVKLIRDISPTIATGGKTNETIEKAIDAGANAISYTPPTPAELFKDIMNKYRNDPIS